MTLAARGNAGPAAPTARPLSKLQIQTRTRELRDRIFRFIVGYKESYDGNSPSLRKIGNAVGINSTAWVNYYLDRLEDEGRIIRRHDGTTGQIEVVGGRWVYRETEGNATTGVLRTDPVQDHR